MMDRLIKVLEYREQQAWRFHKAVEDAIGSGRKTVLYHTSLTAWANLNDALCDAKALAREDVPQIDWNAVERCA